MSSLLNAQTASREYATRPADERFASLQALVDVLDKIAALALAKGARLVHA